MMLFRVLSPWRWRKLSLCLCLQLTVVECWATIPGGKRHIPTTTAPEQQRSTTRTIVLEDEFITPERDPRSYRLIKLANNLMALLVSDGLKEGVGVEAASVHVKAGHFDDTVPGLAHFHEHMLFLGNEKYPDEDEYEAYLSQNGGFSNAYTDMEDTNYYCSISTDASSGALAGALDRLAQFFVAPTFDANAVERELRAIDSEYRNGKTSDVWRSFQLLKSVANPKHPFAKFGCGNYETLNSVNTESGSTTELLNHLRQFWKDYYQSYNLRLAVVGHASLDELQTMVEDTFGQIPYSEGPARHVRDNPGQVFPREHAVYGTPAFGQEQLGLVRHVIPFAEQRKIKINFATPPLVDPVLKASRPYRALSHALGHEAPGSLHAVLNEEDLVTSLTSGFALETSDFSMFSLSLSLTPKGMQQRQRVLDLVFQWMHLLRQQSHEQWEAYHNELREISLMNFRYRENSDPVDFCSAASELLFTEDTEPSKLLIGSSNMAAYDPVVADAFFERLKPSNCFITVTNSDFDDSVGTWKTEKWYGARYSEEPLAEEQLSAWAQPAVIDPRLNAPGLNKYIPTDFSLRCDDADAATCAADSNDPPRILIDEPKLRLWHKMDQHWRVPKTHIKAAFLSPTIYQTPRSMTLNRIFQRVLDDDLNSYIYDASLAGCRYRVTSTPTGYRISVQGYSEKLPFLFETLTTRIFTLIEEMKEGSPLLEGKFEKAKHNLARETKNYRLDAPHEVANYNARLLLEERVWYLDNYINVMEGEEAERFPLTLRECAEAAAKTFQTSKCEALCMGNVNEKEARLVGDVLRTKFLDSSPIVNDVELPTFRSMLLPTKEEATRIFGQPIRRKIPMIYQELAFAKTEENNAIEVLFQMGSELELGYEGIVVIDLLVHMAYTSAFSTLRTKEQLGYIVSAHGRKTTGGGWGFVVVVQGSTALPEIMEERVEAWLEVFRDELESMTVEEIRQEADAVAAQYLERDTKLSHEINRMWGEILGSESMTDPRLRIPDFERPQKLAASLASSSGEDLKRRLLEAFDTHLNVKSPKRRAVSSRVYRHDRKKEYEASKQNNVGVLSSYADIRHVKHFMATMPDVAYWRRPESF